MRNVIKTLATTVFLSVCAFTSAMAAEISIFTYEGGTQTYIDYYGETEAGDLDKFKSVLAEAKRKGTFSGNVYLEGPGGNALEGMAIAEYIRAQGLTTVVTRDCYSACAIIWLGGDSRALFDGGALHFHLPYLPIDPLDPEVGNIYEAGKNAYGWQAILDWHNNMIAESISNDLSLGIKDPVAYILQLSKTTPQKFYVVDNSYDLKFVIGGLWIK